VRICGKALFVYLKVRSTQIVLVVAFECAKQKKTGGDYSAQEVIPQRAGSRKKKTTYDTSHADSTAILPVLYRT
jgi:hypothetical protein